MWSWANSCNNPQILISLHFRSLLPAHTIQCGCLAGILPHSDSGIQALSFLWVCLPQILGALSIQLVDEERERTTNGRFSEVRSGILLHSIGQNVITWPLLTSRKAGKCSPTTNLGGKGNTREVSQSLTHWQCWMREQVFMHEVHLFLLLLADSCHS